MPEPLEIRLLQHYERKADESNIPESIQGLMSPMLEHQLNTFEALRTNDLVVNTYPTGTGKTLASLLHIVDRPQTNVLVIAPTNELIRQHANDIKRFIENANLTHIVVELNAEVIRSLDPENVMYRQGARLHRALDNPREFPEEFKIPEDKRDIRSPVVVVTNPDIFYYALYCTYKKIDQRNVFQDILGKYDYVVIDEFHYYNPKQLSNFLFYFALSLGLGHFKDGKKICLLSATPSVPLREYLERLSANGMKYAEVSPQPVSSDDPLAICTLAPIDLRFVEGDDDVCQFVAGQGNEIRKKISNGEDGVIISDSLIDISRTIQRLRSSGFTKSDYRRITGPYKQRDYRPLVLATPTVDIGYNFEGRDKARQNIDFIIFTSQFTDTFWQRLGRAGRVLGKSEIDIPAKAVCIVSPEKLIKISEKLNNISQAITRWELKELLKDAIPENEPMFDYFQSYAISESFYPIFKLSEMMSDRQQLLENIYDLVKRTFAPHSKRSYKSLFSFVNRYMRLKDLVSGGESEPPHKKMANNLLTSESKYYRSIIQEFKDSQRAVKMPETYNKDILEGAINDNDAQDWSKCLKSKPKLQVCFDQYVNEEFYSIRSLFKFRSSLDSVSVVAQDPHNLYVDSDEVRTFDLFHIVRFCEADFYKDVNEFTEQTGVTFPAKGDFYCRLNRLRNKAERLYLEFALLARKLSIETADEFKRRYCNHPIAINNLRLIATKQDGPNPLPPDIVNAISEHYVQCFIVNKSAREYGKFCGIIKKSRIFSYDLSVTFGDSSCHSYEMVVGTDAFLVGAKAEKGFYALQRKTEFYIC